MVPSFDYGLSYNYNHHMYTDDLILVSNATRKAARNFNLYLTIYARLTGQRINYAKSEVLFPDWFNKKLSKSIRDILKIRIGVFPFTYLGNLISLDKLAMFFFQNMVSKASSTISN